VTKSMELTCKEVVELVTDYLEGAMILEERARFEEHLAFCDGCVNYVGQIRATIRSTAELTEESIPPSLRDELVKTFRNWQRAR